MGRTITTYVVKDAVTFPRKRLGEPMDMTDEEFDEWLAEVKREAAREAWEEGVATALNHAKRGSDGITLKLVTFDGDAWTNPYREKEGE